MISRRAVLFGVASTVAATALPAADLDLVGTFTEA